MCEGFGCSEAIGIHMACVVVAVGEDYDPMYGSEVWGIVQGVYAQHALLTCSLTTLKPSSLSLERLARFPGEGCADTAVHEDAQF